MKGPALLLIDALLRTQCSPIVQAHATRQRWISSEWLVTTLYFRHMDMYVLKHL
jgi:hypothetical protein